MVAKSKASKKQGKIKVGKLKGSKGKAKDLTTTEAKKVRGGAGYDVKANQKWG